MPERSPYYYGGGTASAVIAKKKAPPAKPVGSTDPANAVPAIGGLSVSDLSKMTPQQLATWSAWYQAQGPDYSGVPKVDFTKLQNAAWEQAGKQSTELAAPYQAERTRLKATNDDAMTQARLFSQAFASIAGGGNPNIDDPAAQKYALENFGGSYVGAMAASLGQQLISQQLRSFTARDEEIAGKIADIMDARPDLAEKIYKSVADDAADQIKAGRSIAEMSFKNILGAYGTLIKAKRDSAGGGNVTYVTQPGGGVVGFDKATGQVVYTIPGTGGAGGGKTDTRLRSVGGSVYEQDPVTGKWSVVIPGKGSGGASGESSSTISNTVNRATTAGDAALEKLIQSGRLEQILREEKIWNDRQLGLTAWSEADPRGPTRLSTPMTSAAALPGTSP